MILHNFKPVGLLQIGDTGIADHLGLLFAIIHPPGKIVDAVSSQEILLNISRSQLTTLFHRGFDRFKKKIGEQAVILFRIPGADLITLGADKYHGILKIENRRYNLESNRTDLRKQGCTAAAATERQSRRRDR